MNSKFIVLSIILSITNNTISMESNRKTPILPLEMENIDKLPKNEQNKIFLRLFEEVVDKNLSVLENLRNLMRRYNDLFWTSKSPDFNAALTINKQFIFKKMAYELSKVFSIQDLKNALIEPKLSKEQVELLLLAGAQVNYNNGYTTPLITAARDVNLVVIQFLIDNKADVNAIASKGRYMGQTPLISLVSSKAKSWLPVQEEAIKALLDAGATVNIKDADGKTALDYAKDKGSKDIEKMLVEAEEKQLKQ